MEICAFRLLTVTPLVLGLQSISDGFVSQLNHIFCLRAPQTRVTLCEQWHGDEDRSSISTLVQWYLPNVCLSVCKKTKQNDERLMTLFISVALGRKQQAYCSFQGLKAVKYCINKLQKLLGLYINKIIKPRNYNMLINKDLYAGYRNIKSTFLLKPVLKTLLQPVKNCIKFKNTPKWVLSGYLKQ